MKQHTAETFAVFTAAGVTLAASLYAAAYCGLTRSSVSGYESRRGKNRGFTVRLYSGPAIARFFAPAAAIEGLFTGRDVTTDCPTRLTFDAPKQPLALQRG